MYKRTSSHNLACMSPVTKQLQHIMFSGECVETHRPHFLQYTGQQQQPSNNNNKSNSKERPAFRKEISIALTAVLH